jgi:hypothetical protein
MSGLLGMPKVFVSSDRSSYTIEYAIDGPWVDEGGESCHLMTLNAAGNPLRYVTVGTDLAGDLQAIANYGLVPWSQARLIDRRREGDRRKNPERRHASRRETGQPPFAKAPTDR